MTHPRAKVVIATLVQKASIQIEDYARCQIHTFNTEMLIADSILAVPYQPVCISSAPIILLLTSTDRVSPNPFPEDDISSIDRYVIKPHIKNPILTSQTQNPSQLRNRAYTAETYQSTPPPPQSFQSFQSAQTHWRASPAPESLNPPAHPPTQRKSFSKDQSCMHACA